MEPSTTQTPAFVARDYCVKAAISLNNMGVSLLAKGDCREAAKLLSDAMDAMSLVPTLHRSTRPFGTRILDDVRHSLYQAHRTKPSTHIDLNAFNENWPILCVISSQLHPARLYATFTTQPMAVSLRHAYPMTIDPIDYEDNAFTVNNARFFLATILYNYGIALNCILALAANSSNSTSSCDGSTATAAAAVPSPMAEAPIRKGRLGPVTRDNVRNLFRLSSAMVFGIENSSEMKDSLHSSSCVGLRSQIALLQMVVTNNLIYVAIKQRTEVEFNEYCYSMQRLLFNVEMQHARLPMSDGRLAAAA